MKQTRRNVPVNGFDTTQWSLILASAKDGASGDVAFERLCTTYRAPVLAYLRGRSATREDAEDLTQAFFAHLLRQRLHLRADRERGSFRSFLLGSIKHFVISEQRRLSAEKRGGGVVHVPLDTGFEVSDDDTPERAFDRAWAQAVVAQAIHRLREEASSAGKQDLFDALRGFLFESPGSDDYGRVSDRFGMSRNTVAVAVHRLRQRLQELVRDVVDRTVEAPAQLPIEIAAVENALAGRARM